jgi:hypothetical protein
MINKLKTQRLKILIVAVIFGAIGTYLLIGSKAASPFASLDADKGTLAGNASIQSNSSATNGTYVQFNAPSTSTSSPIPANFKLLRKATKVSDWDAVLIEKYNGSITDTPLGIRYWVPGPSNEGFGRVETQMHKQDIPSNSGEAVYKWKAMVPSKIALPVDSDGYTTFSQHHGNNQAGYTGGTGLMLNGELHARFEGGKRLDNNNYESEIELNVGKFSRDVFHEIAIHVLWDESQLNQNPKGFAEVYLDGVKRAEVHNVPTMGPQADIVMMRVGWYPSSVGPTGLELYVSDYEIWVPS